MIKCTELMERILKSKEAQKIIDYMSPIYGESYVFLWIIQSIGVALDEGESAIAEFMNQIVPQTATWFLKYWEIEYGVTPDPSWTIEQRREAVMAAMCYKSPINPAKLENILSSLMGVDVSIDENTGNNKFTVYIKGYTEDTKKAIETIERSKPAHLIYDLVVADYVEIECKNYHAVFMTEHENIQINVL